MSGDSIVRKTGQLWRVYLAYWSLLVGIGMGTLGWIMFDPDSKFGAALLLAGVHLMFGSIVFASIAIRCPVCRTKWLLDSKTRARRNIAGPLDLLLSLSECPRCETQNSSAEKEKN